MNAPGLFWHVHHDKLFEWSAKIQERIDYIKANKPANEIATRLRLLKPVRGPLPETLSKAYAEWVKACAEWDNACAKRANARAEWVKARAEWVKAYAEWVKACAKRANARAEWDKAWAEWDNACAKRANARAEWDKAWAEWDNACVNHADGMNALHATECPDCPWNGETIFPTETEE